VGLLLWVRLLTYGHDYCQTWITRQYEKTYDPHTKSLMTRHAADKATSSARLYEATRLVGQYNLP